jgi:anthranilate synthase component 1
MAFPGKESFQELVWSARPAAAGRRVVVPVWVSLLDDQLTPVLAYRRLVAPDEREAPSFLLESVEGGERQGRHSILGAQPTIEIVAHAQTVRTIDRKVRGRGVDGVETVAVERDPLEVPRRVSAGLHLAMPVPVRGATLPKCFLGGWVGFAGYDTVRYAEPEKLDAARGPRDDRGLPDLHLAYYDGVVVFDHVDKLVHVVHLVEVAAQASETEIVAAYEEGLAWIERRVRELRTHSEPMASGRMARPTGVASPALQSNLTRQQHAEMVGRALEYIRAGDIFQVVVGQRFEKRSKADPFDVYRALRAVNPSPYMVYMQAKGCILVASSPEILCRVRSGQALDSPALRAGNMPDEGREAGSESQTTRIVTNRPLAGTRRRGATPEEDKALERELLADPKEIAEHVMLVDLGRNDVGKVAVPGTIQIPARLVVERYSHVMHISSTVTGELREGLDCWDALRAALPVGTISGAPKIRAMQIIDELEPLRRGPYGGGMGYVGLDGDMDIALALRTMVVPTALRGQDGTWMYHIQAAGGIVADSKAEEEFQETVNKAAALARAIEVAEGAFGGG